MNRTCLRLSVSPFVLGVCGSIAAGKSSRCKHVAATLAPKATAGTTPVFPAVLSINGDHVGHRVYLPETPTYDRLISAFGTGIVGYSREEIEALGPNPHCTPTGLPLVNRRRLGAAVFGDAGKLSTLNSIVWPAINAAVKEGIERFSQGPLGQDQLSCGGDITVERRGTEGAEFNQSRPLVVLEAALLHEVGLHMQCDEVWLVGCSVEEAVRRVVQRDAICEADARRRVHSQPTAEERHARLKEAVGNGRGGSLRWVRHIDTTNAASPEAGNALLQIPFRELISHLDA